MGVEVYDNFLSSYHFDIIQSFFMGDRVPWFWKDEVVYTNEPGDDYQFNTSIHDHGNKYDSFSLIEPCIAKLGCSSIGRIKANLRPKTLFHRKSGYHIDCPNVTTAVYYLNTNNGWTDIKGHGKVKSVSNRIVIFDSNLVHQGVTCTDEKRRVVLNFNYV